MKKSEKAGHVARVGWGGEICIEFWWENLKKGTTWKTQEKMGG